MFSTDIGGGVARLSSGNRRVRTPRSPLSFFLGILLLSSLSTNLFAAGQNKIVYDTFDW